MYMYVVEIPYGTARGVHVQLCCTGAYAVRRRSTLYGILNTYRYCVALIKIHVHAVGGLKYVQVLYENMFMP